MLAIRDLVCGSLETDQINACESESHDGSSCSGPRKPGVCGTEIEDESSESQDAIGFGNGEGGRPSYRSPCVVLCFVRVRTMIKQGLRDLDLLGDVQRC